MPVKLLPETEKVIINTVEIGFTLRADEKTLAEIQEIELQQFRARFKPSFFVFD